ncbi:sigma-70 region 4 domain-containing protein [Streptomyces sp. AS58]|uniref:sigma-70 region 4 domain-containing protein n=1 Tax=Streptomyces sp. AS58 TaxID=1519489 RepID=UPI000B321749|nr:sigma-70 region 4 domain-containing protein [Streptomyces sp. AS58]
MADDQQLWEYPEVAAHLGISVRAARSRMSRGTLPEPDDTSVPDRPRWRHATFQGWQPVNRGPAATCTAPPDPTAPHPADR